jgi:sec-independent protein translocase protein TatB
MFFDLGWSEMLVIGAVALVVIGPKELPSALRTAGYWVRKARSLSREFQGTFEQMIREAELDEVRRDLKKATEFDLEGEFRKTVDPTGALADSVKLPSVPDYFSETPGTSIAGTPIAGTPSVEGAPVPTPPPVMIGFDEPGTADAAPAPMPDRPAAEPAASRA